MLKIELEIPEFKLEVRNEGRALQAAADVLAQAQRGRIMRGQESDGSAMPEAKDSKRGPEPLIRSGALLASVKAWTDVPKSTALAGPTGERQKVARVLAAKGRDPWEPTASDIDAAIAAYDREIEIDIS